MRQPGRDGGCRHRSLGAWPGRIAGELAETLTFLADSLTDFVGHTAYNTDTLGADLHRFVYLLGASVGEELQFPLRLPAYPDTGSTPLARAGARYGGTQDQI